MRHSTIAPEQAASTLEYIMSLAILLFVGVALSESLRQAGFRRYVTTLEALRGENGMAPCSEGSPLKLENGECL